MQQEEFYTRCAELLGCDHEYHEAPGPVHWLRHDGTIRNTRKNRWNDRHPGNGRFPGHGLIRHFGIGVHVSLNKPRLQGVFDSPEAALAAIEQALK